MNPFSATNQTEAQQKAKEAEAKRLAVENAAKAAFQKLRDNKDFDIAWQWLQRRFPLYASSFVAGDEQNTHKAAMRDGEKNVIRYMMHMLSLPREADYEDGDAKDKPATAVSELSVTTNT